MILVYSLWFSAFAGASAVSRNTVSGSSSREASFLQFRHLHRSRPLLEAKEGMESTHRCSIRTPNRGLPFTAEAVSEINPGRYPHRRIPRYSPPVSAVELLPMFFRSHPKTHPVQPGFGTDFRYLRVLTVSPGAGSASRFFRFGRFSPAGLFQKAIISFSTCLPVRGTIPRKSSVYGPDSSPRPSHGRR